MGDGGSGAHRGRMIERSANVSAAFVLLLALVGTASESGLARGGHVAGPATPHVASSHAPASTSPSDFNGDGFADLAVAEPQEAIGSVTLAGAVSVFYGSSTGIGISGNQLWSQATMGIADAPETDDGFGFTLAAADFNLDGFGDLAVGVPREDLEGTTTIGDAGAVQVIFGSASGLTKTGNQLFTQTGSDPDAVPEEGDRFGWALAAGDLNGDGVADLAIGAPDEAIGTAGFAGGVSVLFGSPGGLTTTGAQFWSRDSVGIDGVAEGGDAFGRALATADLGNGPQADLAIGAPLENVGAVPDAGAAHVLYGSPSGPTATGSQLWTQDTGTVKDAAEDSDQFGSSLSGGDFDADGAADLAIGVPRETVGTASVAGAANVLYGTASGLTDGGNQFWSQASSGIQETPEFLDLFGTALAAGDFDGDGDADLAVGVPGEPAPGGATAGGGVNMILGTPGTGLAKTGNRFIWQDTAGFDDATEPSDFFGRALTAADFGFGPEIDVAVGVPEEEVGTPTAAGAFHMVYGSPTGLSSGVPCRAQPLHTCVRKFASVIFPGNMSSRWTFESSEATSGTSGGNPGSPCRSCRGRPGSPSRTCPRWSAACASPVPTSSRPSPGVCRSPRRPCTSRPGCSSTVRRPTSSPP
jgi:hypothetical protein